MILGLVDTSPREGACAPRARVLGRARVFSATGAAGSPQAERRARSARGAGPLAPRAGATRHGRRPSGEAAPGREVAAGLGLWGVTGADPGA